jgi:hypothetical protein
MVKSETEARVSNHEGCVRHITLRDAAQAPLLRMRVKRTDEREMQGHQV